MGGVDGVLAGGGVGSRDWVGQQLGCLRRLGEELLQLGASLHGRRHGQAGVVGPASTLATRRVDSGRVAVFEVQGSVQRSDVTVVAHGGGRVEF